MAKLLIVRRSLQALVSLPRAEGVHGPDASIQVDAMAAFIHYAGRQIALPTLGAHAGREELLDGVRLIASLSIAGWNEPVLCLLKCTEEHTEASATRFTPARAGQAGTDAVLVSFKRALGTDEICEWLGQWLSKPHAIEASHFGWRSLGDAFDGDWITFVRHLETRHADPVPIVAINGRYAPWIHPGQRV